MTQVPRQIPANSSRLVRFLADWGVTATAAPREHFAQRLGQLFDLPDSIRISAAHNRPATAQAAATVSRDELRTEFLRVRAAIINSTLQSFVPGSGATRLPFPMAAAPVDEGPACEPYLTFYAARQRDIDFRIRKLQAQTREALAGMSTRLARLAALDAALGEPLASHNRRFFSNLGELLRKRIELQLAAYRQERAAAGQDERLWADTLARLRAEMQGLLLAEIETRLLPTQGLIEALDEPDEE